MPAGDVSSTGQVNEHEHLSGCMLQEDSDVNYKHAPARSTSPDGMCEIGGSAEVAGPEPWINDFSTADNRKLFCHRLEKSVQADFVRFKTNSVDIYVQRGSCECPVDELKRRLRVGPDIDVTIKVLAQPTRVVLCPQIIGEPGDVMTNVRRSVRVNSRITLFLQHPSSPGLVYVMSTGHEWSVGDKVYLGDCLEHELAIVDYVPKVNSNRTDTNDLLVASIKPGQNRFVLSNEMTINGRVVSLRSAPLNSEEAAANSLRVQMFCRCDDVPRKGRINGWIYMTRGCGKAYDDCLDVEAEDGGPFGDRGYSGMLLTNEASDGQVSGCAVVMAKIPENTLDDEAGTVVPGFTIALALDRQLRFICDQFKQLRIMTEAPETVNADTEAANNTSCDVVSAGDSVQSGVVSAERRSAESQSGRNDDVSLARHGVTAGAQTQAETAESAEESLHEHTRMLLYTRLPETNMHEHTRMLVYTRLPETNMEIVRLLAETLMLGCAVIISECITVWLRNTSAPGVSSRNHQRFDKELVNERRPQQCTLVDVPAISAILWLPWELHEMLLLRCACLLAATLLKTDARPDIQVFNTLSSVCQRFHTVLTAPRVTRRFRVMSRRHHLRPSLLATLAAGQGNRPVAGLTKLNNALYVVYVLSDTINVYTAQQPHTQLRSIAVNGLKNPVDIAACGINNCLYVSDPGRCVWRVRTDHKVDEWLSELNVARPSVTSEGLVVLLMATDIQDSAGSRTWRGRVEVYNAAGVRLTIVKLPASIANPRHVVQTANKSFIVCHQSLWAELCRVCEVNDAGNILTSYGGSRGSGLGQLDTPCHIALDSEERVLLADNGNRRVLLLSRQLDIQRVLLSWSRDYPGRLFYDKETRQLIVGLGSGQVEIYSLH